MLESPHFYSCVSKILLTRICIGDIMVSQIKVAQMEKI